MILVAIPLIALTERAVAQVDECLAQIDVCSEGSRVPPDVTEDIYLRDAIWHLLVSNDNSREKYYVGAVGLEPASATTLAEYARGAVASMATHSAMLKDRFCARLEGVTGGTALREITRDWGPMEEEHLYRLVAGVFSVLDDSAARLVLQHANELRQTITSYRGDSFVDYENLTPIQVARMVEASCAPDLL